MLFTMGKVSILKVTCLAVERWYCIFQPLIKVQATFHQKEASFLHHRHLGCCMHFTDTQVFWSGNCRRENAPP